MDFADDNLSVEANFGDTSSCCVSDVSSISFQNVALEDGGNCGTGELTRQALQKLSADNASESSDFQVIDEFQDDEQGDGPTEDLSQKQQALCDTAGSTLIDTTASLDGTCTCDNDTVDVENDTNSDTLKRYSSERCEYH